MKDARVAGLAEGGFEMRLGVVHVGDACKAEVLQQCLSAVRCDDARLGFQGVPWTGVARLVVVGTNTGGWWRSMGDRIFGSIVDVLQKVDL